MSVRSPLIVSVEAVTLMVSEEPEITAKSAEVAKLVTAGLSGAITVSTLAEAGYFLRHGFRDMTYAVGIVPAKLDDVARVQAEGARINIIADDVGVGPAARQ